MTGNMGGYNDGGAAWPPPEPPAGSGGWPVSGPGQQYQQPANPYTPQYQGTSGYQPSDQYQQWGAPQEPSYGQGYTPAPGAPKGSSKKPLLIILAVVIVLVAAGVGGWFIWDNNKKSDSSDTAQITYTVPPSGIMLTDSEMKSATLQPLKPVDDLYTKIDPDTATSDPNCALINDPTTNSSFGKSTAFAYQSYSDGDSDKYDHWATGSAAIFNTPDDANAALDAVNTQLGQCGEYTSKSSGAQWKLLSHDNPKNALQWKLSQTDSKGGWTCSKMLKVSGNLVVTASLCGDGNNDAVTKIADALVTKATDQNKAKK